MSMSLFSPVSIQWDECSDHESLSKILELLYSKQWNVHVRIKNRSRGGKKPAVPFAMNLILESSVQEGTKKTSTLAPMIRMLETNLPHNGSSGYSPRLHPTAARTLEPSSKPVLNGLGSRIGTRRSFIGRQKTHFIWTLTSRTQDYLINKNGHDTESFGAPFASLSSSDEGKMTLFLMNIAYFRNLWASDKCRTLK